MVFGALVGGQAWVAALNTKSSICGLDITILLLIYYACPSVGVFLFFVMIAWLTCDSGPEGPIFVLREPSTVKVHDSGSCRVIFICACASTEKTVTDLPCICRRTLPQEVTRSARVTRDKTQLKNARGFNCSRIAWWEKKTTYPLLKNLFMSVPP